MNHSTMSSKKSTKSIKSYKNVYFFTCPFKILNERDKPLYCHIYLKWTVGNLLKLDSNMQSVFLSCVDFRHFSHPGWANYTLKGKRPNNGWQYNNNPYLQWKLKVLNYNVLSGVSYSLVWLDLSYDFEVIVIYGKKRTTFTYVAQEPGTYHFWHL